MKTLLLFAAMISASLSAFGQGTVEFANSPSTRVYNGLTGQPVARGTSIATTFMIGLYWAPDGETNESAFALLGAPTNIAPLDGRYDGGVRTAPISPPGGFAMFQVRGWETAYGTNHESAAAAPPLNGRRALVGKSNIMRVDTANPTSTPPEPARPLLEFRIAIVHPPGSDGRAVCLQR